MSKELLCPKCDGITVEHTLRRMKELSEENVMLRERIQVWRWEYTIAGCLSDQTLTEMETETEGRTT